MDRACAASIQELIPGYCPFLTVKTEIEVEAKPPQATWNRRPVLLPWQKFASGAATIALRVQKPFDFSPLAEAVRQLCLRLFVLHQPPLEARKD